MFLHLSLLSFTNVNFKMSIPKKKIAVIWFRQDLRLHDNEALCAALKEADEVYPVFVFDERTYKGTTRWFDFPKTGKFRAQFVIECIADLKKSLQKLGCDLVVRTGRSEVDVFELAQKLQASWVFCNMERTQEELSMQDSLEKKLWTIGAEMRYSRGKMLYHTQDLPFPVAHTPDVFTHFRKEVERTTKVRTPLETPSQFNTWSEKIDVGAIPTISDFGHEDFTESEAKNAQFKGGETEGLARLKYYLWDSNLIKTYKETRNELLGLDYSSKFSPWLAQGCLSPKTIYHEIVRYEAARGANESTYWLFFELIWRDFFRLMGKKYGNKIFMKGGTSGEEDSRWRNDDRLMQIWIEGRTGVPFIDANMKELSQTGFMSNRGRQNVASFLVKDLLINWQMGAEYFESILIDYDVCSNWGNWNYVAGVGSDPRENRYFNIITQAKRYDHDGKFVKYWLPELKSLPPEHVHQPDLMSFSEQEKYGVKLGAHYPKAMINTRKWAR